MFLSPVWEARLYGRHRCLSDFDPTSDARCYSRAEPTPRPAHRVEGEATADCATAEVYATASMMMEAPAAVALLDSVGLAGLVVGSDGGVHRTSTLAEFIA